MKTSTTNTSDTEISGEPDAPRVIVLKPKPLTQMNTFVRLF